MYNIYGTETETDKQLQYQNEKRIDVGWKQGTKDQKENYKAGYQAIRELLSFHQVKTFGYWIL